MSHVGDDDEVSCHLHFANRKTNREKLNLPKATKLVVFKQDSEVVLYD